MIKQNYYLTLTTRGKQTRYHLPSERSTTIGRESSCQIPLDSTTYRGISQRHVKIRPLSRATNGSPRWQVCDLRSTNGTHINGQRLQGCQTLKLGDRITLAKKSAEFLFECQAIAPTSKPGFQPLNIQAGNSLRLSEVLPIFSTKQDLIQKGLIPGVITVLLVVGLFTTIGFPVVFNALLGTYLAGIGYYFIYQMVGKKKPWWLLISSGLLSINILLSPLLDLFILFFRHILPGNIETAQTNFISLLFAMFFGAGLMEELLKAIPVFTALWLGLKLKSPWREKIGITEPLDGILVGAASAVGFTLLETLYQYVPGIVAQTTIQYGAGTGELAGLQLLIPRIIGSVAGHMAYSGYFGYFIGLSVLKPSRRWQILGIGYFTASALHAFWNAAGAIHILVNAVAGVLAYLFLLAAILKARKLSPTRSRNFTTQYTPPNNP